MPAARLVGALERFRSWSPVRLAYRDFLPTSDAEVVSCLAAAR